jgi:MFS family permease
MIADSLPAERRGMGFGIVSLIASASTTPGPAVAALLYTTYGLVDGMRIGYGIVVALFLTAAFLRLFRLKETVISEEKLSLSHLFKSYPAAMKESFQVWKKVPQSLFYLFLSILIAQLGFSTVTLYLSVYAVDQLLIDKVVWGLMIAVVPVTTIILAIPIGKSVDKINRKKPLLLALLLYGLAIWLFAYGQFVWFFVSLVIIGAAQVMMDAAFGALQTDLTPRDDRGKVNGFRNFAGCIVMAIGNFTGGILYEQFSPQLPFMFAAASIIPAFILALFLVHPPENREE